MTDASEVGPAYRELRERVIALVQDLDETALHAVAPATPEWRVRDLLAHLGGVTADITSGNMDGVATDAWTARQVEARRDRPVAEILAEWETQGAVVDELIGNFPPDASPQLLTDAATHEHDIRGALEAPGARDSAALAIGFEWTAARAGDGRPARLVTDAGTFTTGRALESGTDDDAGDDVPTVRAGRFELFRAFTGRRSLDQVLAFDWEGEPHPERVLAGIFSFRSAPLVE